MTNQAGGQQPRQRTSSNSGGGGKPPAKQGGGGQQTANGSSGGPPAANTAPSATWQADFIGDGEFPVDVKALCLAHQFDLDRTPCWRRHKDTEGEFASLLWGDGVIGGDPSMGGRWNDWYRSVRDTFSRIADDLAACSKVGCSLDNPDHVAVNSARLYGTGSKAGAPPAPGGPKNKDGGGAGQQASPKARDGSGQQVGPKAQVSEVVEAKPETQANSADPVQSHRSAGVTEGAEVPEQERSVRRAVYKKPSKLQADFKKRNGGRGIAVVTGDIRRQFPHLTLAEAQELLWRRDAEMVKAAALAGDGEVVPEAPPGVVQVAPPTEGSRVEALADPGWAAEMARATAAGHAQGIAFAEHLPPPPLDPRTEAAREKAEKEAEDLAGELAGYQDPTKTRPPTLIALAKGCRVIEVLVAVAGAIHAPAEALNILSEHPDVEVAKAVAAAQAALPDEAAVRLAVHPDVEVRRIVAARPHPSDALQQAIIDQDDSEATFILVCNPDPMELNAPIIRGVRDENRLAWPGPMPEVSLDWFTLACGGDETLREIYFDDNPETFDVFDDHPAERRRYFASAPEIADLYYSTRPEMREADQPEAPEEPDDPSEPDGEASTGGGGWRAKVKQTWEKMGEGGDPAYPNEPWRPAPGKPRVQRWGRDRS